MDLKTPVACILLEDVIAYLKAEGLSPLTPEEARELPEVFAALDASELIRAAVRRVRSAPAPISG